MFSRKLLKYLNKEGKKCTLRTGTAQLFIMLWKDGGFFKGCILPDLGVNPLPSSTTE